MKQIQISTKNNTYPLWIGSHILSKFEKYISSYDKILFFTNKTLWNLYSSFWESILKQPNIFCYILEDGEEYKNLSSISKIYDFMIEHHFSRKSLLCSFGGGVICDMGGFLAASFMRGIDIIQIPTSLLAQVDASIGGKVAINHKEGKNLIGFFYPPKAVIIDVSLLKTLPKKEWNSGMAEVIKHSILSKTEEYFNFLEKEREQIQKQETETLISLIEQSCLIKKYFVEEDFEEKGMRAFLNFGHTYAHALEQLFHYQHISHGEAVAKGCLLDLWLSYEKSWISKEYFEKIQTLFESYQIEATPISFPMDTLSNSMKKDKKNSFDTIKTVFVKIENGKKEFLLNEIEIPKIKKYFEMKQASFLKAVIDIGTNSCRLFIAQVDATAKKIEKELFHRVEIVQLGENVNFTHTLQENAIKRTLACLKDYKQLCLAYGCSDIYCFATSATRDAKNKDFFLEKVLAETGIIVHCISGEEEAEYNFKGVSLAFREKIFIVDIGGGSTEFSMGEQGRMLFRKSLNIGAVRATELFFQNQRYTEEAIENCRSWVYTALKTSGIPYDSNYPIIAVAGTATTQVSVREKMKHYIREKVHLSSVNQKELEDNLTLFLSKTLEERQLIPGLEAKRANVIIAGTIILDCILKHFSQEKFTISEFDNLTGAMIL